ncbi:hemerythrin domain-containing protein [Albimonas sp. CAU 1670]|uniref:hemerythrin domain-containing protein n=1 Tax=Albimonas sp. CAU 1670 TaxID=3032599 RepID=UPI0023DB8498|nr:hemerythrin domain-containing protein [Albimonas sp. CAU 1670]MDF2232771.1 hemerythrin domain-containing protein [Albimonas sp. CAU 1670]
MTAPLPPELDPALALDQRPGLPEDLRFLLGDYPRHIWGDHPNFGPTTRFYLDRHAMFREAMGVMTRLTDEALDGAKPAGRWSQEFGRIAGFFLQQLHGHHQIEDMHYFPALLKLQPKLQRGFDILDRDHHSIHDALDRFQAGAVGALNALQAGPADPKRPMADVLAELKRMDRLLDRHLFDEEEIVIPIMLDAGEASLGL